MNVQLHVWRDPNDRTWHVAYPIDGAEHETWGYDTRAKAIESARERLAAHYHHSRETAKPVRVQVKI